ncbi:ribonuclease H2 subunit C [Hyposmocoma kahamanoa]|uniref:ribonuclease H2 subunit C n=1 Tax=Hyposmocoma kahamanoa TaxID=1477025 RepID=UPI000E6D5D9A|nr:ribonuclease H2 subunit C [Hyposmocoma kahamanoa]
MSIQLENNLKNTVNKEVFEQKAHYIPCKIDENGTANVRKYFEPYINSNDNGELTATFRGHPLDGIKMNVPEGYRAVVVTEAKRPLAEDAERRFQVAGGFKQFTYWNWDKKPSKNDNLVKALDWIDIAEAIHGDQV